MMSSLRATRNSWRGERFIALMASQRVRSYGSSTATNSVPSRFSMGAEMFFLRKSMVSRALMSSGIR